VLTEAVIRENYFAGLAAAALIYADLGVIKLEENRVRECWAGFWLISLRTPLFDPSLLERAARAFPPAGFAYQNTLIEIGSALARGYPAPKGLPSRHVTTITVPDNSETKPPSLDAQLHERLAYVEQLWFRAHWPSSRPLMRLSVHVANNDVEALVSDGLSSAALVIWGTESDQQGSAILSANRLRNNQGGPTAQILFVQRCTATGNIVVNDASAARPAPAAMPLPVGFEIIPATTVMAGPRVYEHGATDARPPRSTA
jgi:hypothetical protein